MFISPRPHKSCSAEIRPSIGFVMGKQLEIALRPRPDVDMAAFAGNRKPCVAGMNQTGDAQAGPGPTTTREEDGRTLSAADLFEMLQAPARRRPAPAPRNH
jgi:hypothetical protein